MNTSPVSTQPDQFPLHAIQTSHPAQPAPSPYAERTVRRALRLLEQQLREPGAAFTSTAAVRDWLRLQLATQAREMFLALYLDNQHRLIAHEALFAGTVNRAEVHPRELLKSALLHNAAAVIVAHNHPSGHAEPSRTDQQLTTTLKDILTVVDIRLLDHLVVGGMDIVSFAERGWL